MKLRTRFWHLRNRERKKLHRRVPRNRGARDRVAHFLAALLVGVSAFLFACGTGAIVAPIKAIGEADGKEWSLPDVGRLSLTLRDALLDIQEGKTGDPFDWVVDAVNTQALFMFIDGGNDRANLSR